MREKHYCLDCDKEISRWGKRCKSCANRIKYKGRHLSPQTEVKKGQHISISTEFKKNHKMSSDMKRKIKTTPVKHHVYGRKFKTILELSRGEHLSLHYNAYFYILEQFGKKEIDNYIKWWKRLKNET